jgi:hypothetical protein
MTRKIITPLSRLWTFLSSHKASFLIILFFLIDASFVSKNVHASSFLTGNKPDGRYFTISGAMTNVNYRDLATSPLTYHGFGGNMNFGWWFNAVKSEHLFEIDLGSGAAMTFSPTSDYYQTSSMSTLAVFSLYNHHLYDVERLSVGSFKTSLGGTWLSTTNFRMNPGLMNNSTGIESFINLMFAAKTTFDLSRKSELTQDWIFFTRVLKPVKRDISFHLNAGIVNANFRPGYNYTANIEVDGTSRSDLVNMLDTYRWKVNGWRFSTRLEYTKYRPSGNGRRWSYIWDALSAPGSFEGFQMAVHRIQYTILINRN